LSDRLPLTGFAVASFVACLFAAACGSAEPRERDADAAEPVVLFSSQRDGNDEIYRMRLDGNDPVRLTYHSGRNLQPEMSPDRRWVVFESDRTGHVNIYKMPLEGGEPVNLTGTPSRDGWPRWSPDGRRIAFHSDRDGHAQIYVMNPDGRGVTRLTDHPEDDLFPEWSPDGARLSFRRGMDVWVVNSDGTGARQLTSTSGRDQMANWSPDGTRLAFFSERDGYCAIYIMNSDGSDPVNLTPKDDGDVDDDWCSAAPSWLPDGRILFTSSRPETGGDWEIFIMNGDGSGLARLTHVPGNDWGPRVR
jgi:Tol biopolymer transport system component